MVDLLRRALAPVPQQAWKHIDETAARVLKTQLSARSVVTVEGPFGWEFSAVNLGRLELAGQPGRGETPWGTRRVLPLVEGRIAFTLYQMEIDNIARGCLDANLDSLEESARRIAMFEESAVYNGFPAGQIEGILQKSRHQSITLPDNAEQYPQAVAEGVKQLSLSGVGGPYSLVLGPDAFQALLQSHARGYPVHRLIREIIQGNILQSPALLGGVLLSTAEKFFELTIGQDLSIGYALHDREKVELFFTESFTFRVLQETAAIALRPT